ncbi:MAG: threonine/serine dehydratase [Gemmatimonadales bacterium]
MDLTDLHTAAATTGRYLRHTPLEHSPDLSEATGAEVYLKLENLQITGSFKPRGPFNKLVSLSDAERRRGVVAATAGNHGIGVACAGRRLGVPVKICLPRSADPGKLHKLRSYGAALQFTESYEEAYHLARRLAETEGLTFISAYSDPAIIAADGVVGLEIMEDLAAPDVVIVPCGGGGLVSGISIAVKANRPETEVWLVEAALSPTFNTWLRAGETVPVAVEDSIAEGLAGYVEPETLTWPIIRDNIDRALTATENELAGAMRWMVEHQGQLIEPSGAAAVAVLLRGEPGLKGKNVVAVVSGGNVVWERFKTLVIG